MKYPSFCLRKETREIHPGGKARTIRTWLPGAGGLLRAKIYLPALEEGQKCPAVIVMHGIMTTEDIYPQPAIAKMLQERGMAAVTFDFNGHGCSYGSQNDRAVRTLPGRRGVGSLRRRTQGEDFRRRADGSRCSMQGRCTQREHNGGGVRPRGSSGNPESDDAQARRELHTDCTAP